MSFLKHSSRAKQVNALLTRWGKKRIVEGPGQTQTLQQQLAKHSFEQKANRFKPLNIAIGIKDMPPKTTTTNTGKPQNRPSLKNPSAKPVSNTTKAPVRSPSAPSKPAGSTVRPTPRHPPSATKPATSTATKAPAKPAQQPANEGNWLNRAVQNSVAGVGNYAGGFFTSIGNSVNKVGEGVGNKYVFLNLLPESSGQGALLTIYVGSTTPLATGAKE